MNNTTLSYPCYGALKTHFDKLVNINFLENPFATDLLKRLYLEAFGIKTGMYDVYRTNIYNCNNPIKSIVTFIGDTESEKIPPEGVVMDYHGLVYVNVLNKSILNNGIEYINKIYKSIDDVVKLDILYRDIDFAKNNPYCMLLRLIPFYKTFHHIKISKPDMMDKDIFKALLLDEKIVNNDDDAELLLKSISTGRYTDEPWRIYNTMTCNNSIRVFDALENESNG